MYENIRAIFVRILDNPGRYLSINPDEIELNSAYKLSNLNLS